MNDPGLDEPAQRAAQDVEKNKGEQDRKNAEWEEEDFLEPRHVQSSHC
jgi:potassium channel subfamily K, other eukaryote